MKKILFIAFLMVQTAHLIAQGQVGESPLIAENFLKKSKKQKKAARISMATGVGFFAVSFLTLLSPPTPGGNNDSRVYLAVDLALASFATGAYLHIASGKNKRRAAQSSVFFDLKKDPFLSQTGIKNHSYPAIGFKIII